MHADDPAADPYQPPFRLAGDGIAVDLPQVAVQYSAPLVLEQFIERQRELAGAADGPVAGERGLELPSDPQQFRFGLAPLGVMVDGGGAHQAHRDDGDGEEQEEVGESALPLHGSRSRYGTPPALLPGAPLRTSTMPEPCSAFAVTKIQVSLRPVTGSTGRARK